MKVILAITTFERPQLLKKTIDSWNATKSEDIDWTVIISNDGFDDATAYYLSNVSFPFHLIEGGRRGMMHQTNQIIKFCDGKHFDYGFKIDDDITFIEKGWDHLYINAIKKTKFDHLVLHDVRWKRKKRQRSTVTHSSGLLECKAYCDDTQGALWTFTPRTISMVGYMDLYRFGMYGFGHRDYTFRCCKAGLNQIDNIYDVKDSDKYIKLNIENYQSTPELDRISKMWLSDYWVKRKHKNFSDETIYVPFHDRKIDIFKNPLFKLY